MKKTIFIISLVLNAILTFCYFRDFVYMNGVLVGQQMVVEAQKQTVNGNQN